MESHLSISEESPPAQRREKCGNQATLQLGPVGVNLPEFTVRVSGRPVALTRLEFDILVYLMDRAPRVVSQDELLNNVVRGAHDAQSSIIRVHVCNLRRKLGADGWVVRTVRGRGLQFRERV